MHQIHRVFVRVLVESGILQIGHYHVSSCDTQMAIDLMVKAEQLGLQPYGCLSMWGVSKMMSPFGGRH